MSKKFAIVKGSVVDGIAIADAPLQTDGTWIDLEGMDPQSGPGWTYEDGAFSPPVPPPPPPKIITKLAFRFRLTDMEYVGILQASKDNVEVQAWVETFNMVTQIDLDNQHTKDGVAVLVDANLLTEARAEEILTAVVQPGERL